MTSYDLLARGTSVGLPGSSELAESLSGISRRTYEDRLSVLVDSGVLPERMRPTRSQSADVPSYRQRKEKQRKQAVRKSRKKGGHGRLKSDHQFFDILTTLCVEEDPSPTPSPAIEPMLPRSFPGVLPETRHRGNTYDLP